MTGRRIVSSPASERRGHARPRGLFAPRPRDSGVPGQNDVRSAQNDGTPSPPGEGPSPLGGMPGQNGRPPESTGGPPDQNGTAPRPRPARLAPGGSRSPRHVAVRPGRKSSPAIRRSKRSRIAAVAIVAVGVLVIGLATGFGSEPSAEPTAQAFLFDWQQQQYTASSALTTGASDIVTADLRGAFAQLDATQLFLTMKSVVQHGRTAQASFMATVDLAQQGRVWTYRGQFGLRQVDGVWKVDWTPGVLNPSLGPGDRLAVVTQFPSRASVLDARGDPLQLPTTAYVLGVCAGTPVQPGGDGPGVRPSHRTAGHAGARPDRGCPA